MTPRHRRSVLALVLVCSAAGVAALLTNVFRSNMVFFHSPSDLQAPQFAQQRSIRLGGLVENGTVQRQADGVTVRFVVTDTAKRITVEYRGILPDLFKEGKGVVARGRLTETGLFHADEVLAKHDENYMPPEAADALQRAQKQQARERIAAQP